MSDVWNSMFDFWLPCLMSDVRCLMSDVWCSTYDPQCLMSDVRCLIFVILCLTFDIRCLMSDDTVRSIIFSKPSDQKLMFTLIKKFDSTSSSCQLSVLWIRFWKIWTKIKNTKLLTKSVKCFQQQTFWRIFFFNFWHRQVLENSSTPPKREP